MVCLIVSLSDALCVQIILPPRPDDCLFLVCENHLVEGVQVHVDVVERLHRHRLTAHKEHDSTLHDITSHDTT